MPILIYHDSEGHDQRWELLETTESLRIGSEAALNDIALPPDLGVARRHAVILRAALNRLPVLVNLAGTSTRINGKPVVNIKVLRHKDEIQLDQAHLTMWEVLITTLQKGSKYVGKTCLVCSKTVQPGEEIIVCPRCSTPSHRLCWFTVKKCPRDGCEYPVEDIVREALSPFVRFEKVNTDLLLKRQTCKARARGDQIPFQPGDMIAYCPSASCQSTFHIPCWLNLEYCPVPGCGFEVRKLISQVFSVGEDTAEPSIAHTGEYHAGA